MIPENLHDALNLIDNDMIEAVDTLRQKKIKKKRISIRIVTTAASCFFVALFCIIAIKFIDLPDSSPHDEGKINNGEVKNEISESIDSEEPDGEYNDEYSDSASDNFEEEASGSMSDMENSGGMPNLTLEKVTLTVSELDAHGFYGIIIDERDNVIFSVGDTVRVVFSESANEKHPVLSEGDIVDVTYYEYEEEGIIIAEEITYSA